MGGWPAGAGVTYSYAAGQNNGQIAEAQDGLSGQTTVYQYDALRRLVSASATGGTAWTETFGYDGFGNLTSKALNGTANAIAVDGTTNRLEYAAYDANGNMTGGAGVTLTYDEANRVTSAAQVSGGMEMYGYAPDNRRVYRAPANGDLPEWTLWGAHGEKLGVYSMAPPPGPNQKSLYPYAQVFTPTVQFAGRTVWEGGQYNGGGNPSSFGGKLVITDRLGSNRAAKASYYPYGEEITSTPNDGLKFATYTRDAFTGFDYAEQRFYASSYGRFNSADPYQASGHAKRQLSWNRYSYSAGDPINRLDPHGLEYVGTGYDDSCWWDEDNESLTCTATATASGGGDGGGDDSGDPGDDSGDSGSASGLPPDPPTPASPSGPGSQASSGPRPLDPSSQECQALARKIANVQRDIAEMQNRIDVNPGDLPTTAPGSPAGSVAGHQALLAAAQANLAALLQLYAQKCGGGAPPAVPVRPPVILPPGAKYPPKTKPAPITIGIGVAVGVGAVVCALLPEACAIVAPIVAW